MKTAIEFVGAHGLRLSAYATLDEAEDLVKDLTVAIAKARDPRVRRDSLKPGAYFKMGEGYLVFRVCRGGRDEDNSLYNLGADFSVWPQTSSGDDAKVYRCKDFSGELL